MNSKLKATSNGIPSQFFWLALFLFLVTPLNCHAESEQVNFSARVVSIVDGDTIVVLRDTKQIRIRLAEIDAPERSQPWSNKAKLALGAKIFNQMVTMEVSGKDRYGRSLAWVKLNGREINREMVRDGHAWAFRRYLVTEDLLDEEAAAREQRLGLWSLSNPIPPWNWRRGQREVKAATASPQRNLKCGVKLMCREMVDCAEARFHFMQCGVKSLDGDGDGVPCERLCVAN